MPRRKASQLSYFEEFSKSQKRKLAPSCTEKFVTMKGNYLLEPCEYGHKGESAVCLLKRLRQLNTEIVYKEFDKLYQKEVNAILRDKIENADDEEKFVKDLGNALRDKKLCEDCPYFKLVELDETHCYTCQLVKATQPLDVMQLLVHIILTHEHFYAKAQTIILSDVASMDAQMFHTSEDLIFAKAVRYMRRNNLLSGGMGDACFFSLLDPIPSEIEITTTGEEAQELEELLASICD